MSGKFICLSFFFLFTFFRVSHSLKCYAGNDCQFNPADTDGPDLKNKCEQKECKDKEKCVRYSTLSLGIKMPNIELGRVKRAAPTVIQLDCAKKTKKDCGKLSSDDKSVCACDKDLCNSASNIIPNYFFLLPLWSFVTFLFQGMNV